MRITLRLDSLRWLLIAVLAAILVAGLFAEIAENVWRARDAEDLLEFFSLSEEWNLPTWFSSVLLFSCGAVLAAIAASKRRTGAPYLRHWWALAAGFFFTSPGLLTLLCLLWGFAVVADSAQFSAAVSELTDPRFVGTALTVQTSLGFLLTLLSIRLIPLLRDLMGWERVLGILALGPAFGIWSMLRLRRLAEASRMASGNR